MSDAATMILSMLILRAMREKLFHTSRREKRPLGARIDKRNPDAALTARESTFEAPTIFTRSSQFSMSFNCGD
jgi:hypothetical protein